MLRRLHRCHQAGIKADKLSFFLRQGRVRQSRFQFRNKQTVLFRFGHAVHTIAPDRAAAVIPEYQRIFIRRINRGCIVYKRGQGSGIAQQLTPEGRLTYQVFPFQRINVGGISLNIFNIPFFRSAGQNHNVQLVAFEFGRGHLNNIVGGGRRFFFQVRTAHINHQRKRFFRYRLGAAEIARILIVQRNDFAFPDLNFHFFQLFHSLIAEGSRAARIRRGRFLFIVIIKATRHGQGQYEHHNHT